MATTVQLTIDCADPQALAQFWTTALRYVPEPPPRGHEIWESWLAARGVPESEWHDGVSISDPEGKGPKLYFPRVPEPKTVKNRLHLDLDIATRVDSIATRVDPIAIRVDRFSARWRPRVPTGHNLSP